MRIISLYIVILTKYVVIVLSYRGEHMYNKEYDDFFRLDSNTKRVCGYFVCEYRGCPNTPEVACVFFSSI